MVAPQLVSNNARRAEELEEALLAGLDAAYDATVLLYEGRVRVAERPVDCSTMREALRRPVIATVGVRDGAEARGAAEAPRELEDAESARAEAARAYASQAAECARGVTNLLPGYVAWGHDGSIDLFHMRLPPRWPAAVTGDDDWPGEASRHLKKHATFDGLGVTEWRVEVLWHRATTGDEVELQSFVTLEDRDTATTYLAAQFFPGSARQPLFYTDIKDPWVPFPSMKSEDVVYGDGVRLPFKYDDNFCPVVKPAWAATAVARAVRRFAGRFAG